MARARALFLLALLAIGTLSLAVGPRAVAGLSGPPSGSAVLAAMGYAPLAPGGAACQTAGPPPAGNTVTASAQAAGTEVLFSTACVTPAMTGPVTLQCEAWGIISVGATVPTLRGRVFVNGTPVLDTTAVPGLVTSTNYGWHALFSIAVYSVGASGSVDAQGELRAQIGVTSDLVIPVRNTAPFTINTAGPLSVTLGATWGNNLAGSGIELRQAVCK